MPRGKKIVTGLSEVEANINEQIRRIRKGEERGLIVSGLSIKKESQKNTPRRLGNLANAHFVTAFGFGPENLPKKFKDDKGSKMSERHNADVEHARRKTAQTPLDEVTVAVGNSAIYAVSVHENPRSGAAGAFVGPIAQVKRRKGPKVGEFQTRTAAEVHSQVGGWKFLENAVKQETPKIKGNIQRFARVR